MKRSILAAIAAAALFAPLHSFAQAKLKVGFMLPYSGTYAALGDAIEKGFRLYIAEQGGKVAGREIEFVKLDDESDPAKATDNANKLIKRDNVDVLIGTVHSGVAMAMAKVAKDNGTLLIIPNAGAVAVTGPMCAENIFRSSFSNWQPGYAMGEVAAKRGAKKVVTITWKYAAGDESVGGFKESFEKAGGQVVKAPTPMASSPRCTTATASTIRRTSPSARPTRRLTVISLMCTRCRATMRRRCSPSVSTPQRVTSRRRPRSPGPSSRRRSTARVARSLSARTTTRYRTCTCARSWARTTR
jgi:ABC-type branched-subunit amino acid transport system substrate-binding protein